jgi:hypothetical protein
MFERTYPAAIAKQMLNIKLRTSQTPFLRTTARGRNRNSFRAALREILPSLVDVWRC